MLNTYELINTTNSRQMLNPNPNLPPTVTSYYTLTLVLIWLPNLNSMTILSISHPVLY